VPKPSEAIFKAALAMLSARKIAAKDCVVVGSSIQRDLAPAKKHGFRTALYAGDKHSLAATATQLKDPAERPDALLTDLSQIADIL
jgi:FMN phosphatase YigB (HAD superfamily)